MTVVPIPRRPEADPAGRRLSISEYVASKHPLAREDTML